MSSNILLKESKFEIWQPGKNFIVNILYFVKNIFYDPTYLQQQTSYNSNLGKIFLENIEEYKKEIRSCTEEREVYNSIVTTNNKFYNSKQIHKDLIEKFSNNINSELQPSDKLQEMKKWFFEDYIPKIKNN